MKEIRWGVLGTGAISDDFVSGLAHAPGARLVGVASRTPERAEEFARKHGLDRALSLDGLLQADVDVIYVATPPAQHREHALACLEAGKAVLLEKPFAFSAAEAKQIVAAARRAKRFCMEAMWMRFVPLVRELIRSVRHGKYGAVQAVEASLGFAHPDPAHARDGALLDLGVYPLSLVHAMLGAPKAVKAVGDHGEVSVLLDHSPAQAVVRCSLKGMLRNDAVVWAQKARLSLEAPLYRSESYTVQMVTPAAPMGAREGLSPLGALRTVARRPEVRRWVQRARALAQPRVTAPAIGNGYAHEAIEVNECLRNGALESAVMPLDDSVAVMETVDAVRRAIG